MRWTRNVGAILFLTTVTASTRAFAADVPTSQPSLVTAILGAVRQPADDQFATPESVIKFFVEQVQHQNVDEATKAFPIRELYEHVTWDRFAREYGVLGFA